MQDRSSSAVSIIAKFSIAGFSITRFSAVTGKRTIFTDAAVWGCMAMLGVVGCGGSQSPAPAAATTQQARPADVPPARARGQDRASAEVGPAGGTFELNNGARLEIPTNAFETPTTVMLQLGQRTTAFSNTEYQTTVGPVLAVTPAIVPPEDRPVVLSIPMGPMPEGFREGDARIAFEAPDENHRAFGENSTVTRWHYQKAEIRHGRMTAELDYVPGLRFQFVLSRDD